MQELVGQRRADLQHLEAAELVGASISGCRSCQILEDPVAGAGRAAGRRGRARRPRCRAAARRRCGSARSRSSTSSAVHAALERLVARQASDAGAEAAPQPTRQPPPVVAVPHAEVTVVAAEQFVRPLADQGDLHVLPRALADEVHRHDRRRGDRLLQDRHDPRQRALERVAAELDSEWREPKSRAVSAASASSSSLTPTCRSRRCRSARPCRTGSSSRAAGRSRCRPTAAGRPARRRSGAVRAHACRCRAAPRWPRHRSSDGGRRWGGAMYQRSTRATPFSTTSIVPGASLRTPS